MDINAILKKIEKNCETYSLFVKKISDYSRFHIEVLFVSQSLKITLISVCEVIYTYNSSK